MDRPRRARCSGSTSGCPSATARSGCARRSRRAPRSPTSTASRSPRRGARTSPRACSDRFGPWQETADTPQGDEPQAEAQPADEEELQRRLEEQLRKVRVQDLLLESVASILNLSARRIAKEDERDLEQGRIGIDAVRAVVDLLDPEPREQVREALSQVQMLYAREAQGGGDDAAEAAPDAEPERPAAERPSGLWTPPGYVVIPTTSLRYARLAAGASPAASD